MKMKMMTTWEVEGESGLESQRPLRHHSLLQLRQAQLEGPPRTLHLDAQPVGEGCVWSPSPFGEQH